MSAPGPAPGEGGAACCGEPRAPRPAPARRGPGGTCWEGGWAAAGPASPAAPGRSLRGLAGASRPRQKGLRLQGWGWGSLESPHVRCRLCPSLGQHRGGGGGRRLGSHPASLHHCIPASLPGQHPRGVGSYPIFLCLKDRDPQTRRDSGTDQCIPPARVPTPTQGRWLLPCQHHRALGNAPNPPCLGRRGN